MEAQSIGVSDVPSLEAAAVGKLREKVLKQGGLHVSLDCRNKILAISEVELDETILPLCSWLIGLVEAQGKAAGEASQMQHDRARYERNFSQKETGINRRRHLFARSGCRAYIDTGFCCQACCPGPVWSRDYLAFLCIK